MIGIIKIIILFGIIIGTHELGHFIVAKICKVNVYEFSIGFGPKIFDKQGKETTYTLRLIPLGGYVRLEGEEELSDKEGSFSKASKRKRLAILFAGATVNILLAIIVYFSMAFICSKTYSTEIGEFIKDFPITNSKFQIDDKIIEVNGIKVSKPEDIIQIVSNNKDKEIEIKAERKVDDKNEIIEDKVVPNKVRYLSSGIYFRNTNSTKIAQLEVDSPAEKAGLKVNDIIVSVNGVDVKDNISKLQEYTAKFSEEERDNYNLEFVILRDKQELKITIAPNIDYLYYVGIVFKETDKDYGESFEEAVKGTGELIKTSFKSIYILLSGKAKLEQMSGPIGIADTISRTSGIISFIELFAIISFNIGLINILPIPPLDGFKVLLIIIEAIRRKPVSKEIELKIELFGFMLLIMFSIMIAYSDIIKLI